MFLCRGDHRGIDKKLVGSAATGGKTPKAITAGFVKSFTAQPIRFPSRRLDHCCWHATAKRPPLRLIKWSESGNGILPLRYGCLHCSVFVSCLNTEVRGSSAFILVK